MAQTYLVQKYSLTESPTLSHVRFYYYLLFFSFILKWCSYIPLQYNNFTLYNSYNFGHLVTIHTHTRNRLHTLTYTSPHTHTFTLTTTTILQTANVRPYSIYLKVSLILFNSRKMYINLLFLPTWREKTGKSGHMTVLHFLVCAQGCKISDTVEQTSLPSPSMLDSLSCLPSKMYLLWGKTSKSRESLHCFNDVWRQCWWRWLSLVPYVLRAWHIYLRWTGLKQYTWRLSYTPVARQGNLS